MKTPRKMTGEMKLLQELFDIKRISIDKLNKLAEENNWTVAIPPLPSNFNRDLIEDIFYLKELGKEVAVFKTPEITHTFCDRDTFYTEVI